MKKQPESPLLVRLEAAFAPLIGLNDPAPLTALVPALLDCAERLIHNAAGDHVPLFDNGDDGRALKPFFDSLMAQAEHAAEIRLSDWPELFDLWLSQNTLRRLPRRTPGLYIWGPLEARLMQPDVVILGGLNEASWPPLPETGPWLSRPMREKIGLSLPERQIGLAAHDFAQAASAPRVLLSRAIKIDGTPSVAARWLRRLETLCHGLPRDDGDRLLGWWASLDSSPSNSDSLTSARPSPCPPVAVRPTSLSVTQIETLLFDPYKIYARKILGLRELEPVDAPASAAHRGSLIHTLLERLIRDKRHLGDSIAEDLLAYAEQMKIEMPGGASVMQFWQARLEAISQWFAAYESDRRAAIKDTIVEEFGRLPIAIGGQEFILTAKADRIDRLNDNSYVVIDYKTGQPPSKNQVVEHFAPQLSLTAAILQNGGFAAAGMPAGLARRLDYVQLSGREPPGKVTSIPADSDVIDGALDMVKRLMASYQDEAQAYGSHIRPQKNSFASAYDHLARLAEWRSTLEHEEDAS
jgi:ATP-dependent helicase/nuclease subunit B